LSSEAVKALITLLETGRTEKGELDIQEDQKEKERQEFTAGPRKLRRRSPG